MNELNTGLVFASYGIAGLAYLLLSIPLLARLRGPIRAVFLTIGLTAAVFWAIVHAYGVTEGGLSPFQIFIAEMLHDLVWLFFLSYLLRGAVGSRYVSILRYGGAFVGFSIIALGVGIEYATFSVWGIDDSQNFTSTASVITSLCALIIVEQIYRNARSSQRRSLKFLSIGIAGIFAYDLIMYSDALIEGQISNALWSVRGVVVAMLLPLVAIAIQQSEAWSSGLFVSRKIVLYSATIFGSGVYLTVVGFIGYYIRTAADEWGTAVQIVFLAGAIVAMIVFISSETLRGRVRVQVAKHFFENKYDYRSEWLRLINTLTDEDEHMSLRKRAVKALADIVHSPNGVLWLKLRNGAQFVPAAGWNVGREAVNPMPGNSLSAFLETTGWVVEVQEYLLDKELYGTLELDTAELGVENAAFVVPLLHGGVLQGYVVLAAPTPNIILNFEDRDLLKTAGRQIASYIAQEVATEELTEIRQFEAYNKLTAYLMHDLKNLIAQQSLVVENAQKHKENPEFVDDAVATIRGGVGRMRKVLEHLKQDRLRPQSERIDLQKLVLQAVEQCSDREPNPAVQARSAARIGERG